MTGQHWVRAIHLRSNSVSFYKLKTEYQVYKLTAVYSREMTRFTMSTFLVSYVPLCYFQIEIWCRPVCKPGTNLPSIRGVKWTPKNGKRGSGT